MSSEFDNRQDNEVTEPGWVADDARKLLERDSDLEVVATLRKDAMDPAGTYISNPDEYPLTFSVEEFKGRRVIQLNGLLTLEKLKDKAQEMPDHEVRTRLNFFRLSPDRRNRLVYGEDNKPTGEELPTPDAQSLRWLEARDAYKTVRGEEAKQDIQVVEFLTQHPIRFVMFQGRQGLGVSKIFARK
jgi:hypothetical protein